MTQSASNDQTSSVPTVPAPRGMVARTPAICLLLIVTGVLLLVLSVEMYLVARGVLLGKHERIGVVAATLFFSCIGVVGAGIGVVGLIVRPQPHARP